MIFDNFKSSVVQEKQRLKPALQNFVLNSPDLAFTHRAAGGVALWGLPWKGLVEEVIATILQHRDRTPRATLVSDRPWTLKAGALQLSVASGWKLYLCKTFALLLASLLPIRRKILESCRVTGLVDVGLVTLYTSLDLMCLVGTWLLCAVAPVALAYGELVKNGVSVMWPHILNILDVLGSTSFSEARGEIAILLSDALVKDMHKLLTIVQSGIPAVEWDLSFFLKLAVGSLAFVGMSAAMARIACPRMAYTTCLSIGLCGPLWAFTKEAKGMALASRAARTSLMVRTLLFATVVVWRWRNVDQFSTQLYAAMVFNRVMSAMFLKVCWVVLLVVHCLCGLAAVHCAEQSLEIGDFNIEHRFGSAELPYGTFSTLPRQPSQANMYGP